MTNLASTPNCNN